ncbi:MAG: hypothetical protein U5Q03_06075 [Bacteroidota bacterium]|nr:hypothetical protein [Bacteroidota bacterium]
MATSITKERIKLLNRKNKKKYKVLISDIKDKGGQTQGTLVRLWLPLTD